MPESIPPQDSSKDYLDYAFQRVETAASGWEAFTDIATKAYNKAYRRQGTLLKSIKARLEEERKQAQAVLTFAISLLTVAAVGPVAGALGAKLAGGMEEKAAEEFTKWVIKKAGDGTKAATGAAVKYFYPEKLVEDPFEPAADDPLDYMTTILARVHTREHRFQKWILSFSGLHLPLDEARDIATEVVNSSFVQEAPRDMGPYEGALYRSAALLQWIVWAWDRDDAYWAGRSVSMSDYQEAITWDRVRVDLAILGVPVALITLTVPRTRLEFQWLRPGQTGLNMEGFINWATDVHAAELVFRDLPDSNYVSQAKKELTARIMAASFGA